MDEKPIKQGNMESIEKFMGRVDAKLDNADKEQTKLHNAIFGNGKEGLLNRTTRIENKLDSVAASTGDISEIKSTVNEIKDLLEDHVKDKSIHTLGGMLRAIPTKQIVFVIGTAVLFWIFLHSIIPDSVVFWDLISK